MDKAKKINLCIRCGTPAYEDNHCKSCKENSLKNKSIKIDNPPSKSSKK